MSDDPNRRRSVIAIIEGGHRPSDVCRLGPEQQLICQQAVPGQPKSHRVWRSPKDRYLDRRGVSFHDLSVDFYLRADGTVFLEVNVPADQVIGRGHTAE